MTVVLQTPLFTLEVPEQGAAKGHARIVSSSSSTADVSLFGFISSVLSSLLYEKMQAGGTSIVMSIAKDNVCIDVLARHENDGIDLQWPVKPGDAAQLDAVQERIRAKTFFIKNEPSRQTAPVASGSVAAIPSAHVTAPTASEKSVVPQSSSDALSPADEEREDYLSKQLHRIP